MKKLLNCSAKYDNNTLVSYTTKVVEIRNGIIYMYAYRSNTTLSHIRKFADVINSPTVKMVYDWLIQTKQLCGIYNTETGEFTTTQNGIYGYEIFERWAKGEQ